MKAVAAGIGSDDSLLRVRMGSRQIGHACLFIVVASRFVKASWNIWGIIKTTLVQKTADLT